jgi:nitrite reductase/ring-hydroxylating ferredoxin subunit
MSHAHSPAARIAALEEVPAESTLLFRVRDADGDEREAFLVRLDASPDDTDRPPVAAWINECQHLTHVRLDKGTGAPLRGEEVVCANHGAMFETDTGLCTHGPCEGAYLNGVEVTVADGAVYVEDAAYEYLGRGPVADDDDLTSTSNVEF